MIRDATLDDIPELVGMGRKFADAIGMTETTGFDEESVAALLAHLIESPAGICLITEGGGAGGLVHPCSFNASHMTGQELFWWIEPEHRGRKGLLLFRALERAAQERGAQTWMVSTMESLDFDGAARFYERSGYRPSDRNYIKRF